MPELKRARDWEWGRDRPSRNGELGCCPGGGGGPRLGVREGYLEVQQPHQQGLPGVRCVAQQVLPLDDVDDLGQQQVLGRVPQPGVKDPVRLERGTGCRKASHTGTPWRVLLPSDTLVPP